MKGEDFILEYMHRLARLIAQYFFLFIFLYTIAFAIERWWMDVDAVSFYVTAFIVNFMISKEVREDWKFVLIAPFKPESYRDSLEKIVDDLENHLKTRDNPENERKSLKENPLSD